MDLAGMRAHLRKVDVHNLQPVTGHRGQTFDDHIAAVVRLSMKTDVNQFIEDDEAHARDVAETKELAELKAKTERILNMDPSEETVKLVCEAQWIRLVAEGTLKLYRTLHDVKQKLSDAQFEVDVSQLEYDELMEECGALKGRICVLESSLAAAQKTKIPPTTLNALKAKAQQLDQLASLHGVKRKANEYDSDEAGRVLRQKLDHADTLEREKTALAQAKATLEQKKASLSERNASPAKANGPLEVDNTSLGREKASLGDQVAALEATAQEHAKLASVLDDVYRRHAGPSDQTLTPGEQIKAIEQKLAEAVNLKTSHEDLLRQKAANFVPHPRALLGEESASDSANSRDEPLMAYVKELVAHSRLQSVALGVGKNGDVTLKDCEAVAQMETVEACGVKLKKRLDELEKQTRESEAAWKKELADKDAAIEMLEQRLRCCAE